MKKLTQAVAIASLMASGAAYAAGDLELEFELDTDGSSGTKLTYEETVGNLTAKLKAKKPLADNVSISGSLEYKADMGAYVGADVKQKRAKGAVIPYVGYEFEQDSMSVGAKLTLPEIEGGNQTEDYDGTGSVANIFQGNAEIEVEASFGDFTATVTKPFPLLARAKNTDVAKGGNKDADKKEEQVAKFETKNLKLELEYEMDKFTFGLEYNYNDGDVSSKKGMQDLAKEYDKNTEYFSDRSKIATFVDKLEASVEYDFSDNLTFKVSQGLWSEDVYSSTTDKAVSQKLPLPNFGLTYTHAF